MVPVLRQKRREDRLLWGALLLANIPLLFVPLALTGIQWAGHRFRHQDDLARDLATNNDFTRHNQFTAQAAALAGHMAQKIGVTLRGVFLKPDPIGQGTVLSFAQDSATLFLCLPPDLLKNAHGRRIARGIIAHELGHTRMPVSMLFTNTATCTGFLYAMAAIVCGGSAATIAITQGIAAAAVMAGGTAAALGAALILPGLRARQSRNTEYCADLYGAALFEPDDVITAMRYCRSTEGYMNRYTPQTVSLRGRIDSLCDRFYGPAHPDTTARLELLKTAFNHNGDTQRRAPDYNQGFPFP